MTDRKSGRGPIGATELINQLQNDPDYQRRMQAAEAVRQARVAKLRKAEQPIVSDLRGVGVDVNSVWDLVNTAVPYPAALPVLLKHLEKGGYPDMAMESLGRALAVKPASFAWDKLRTLYLAAQGRGEEEGLAVALAASATVEDLPALIDLLGENSKSDTRIHFLRTIKRLGGQRGRDILEELRSDPLFGKEATALLRRFRGWTAKVPG
jgi:hypothetical protein